MAIFLLRHCVVAGTPEDAAGFVVRARTEEQARALVAKRLVPAMAAVWLDRKSTDCIKLESDGPAAVFLVAVAPSEHAAWFACGGGAP